MMHGDHGIFLLAYALVGKKSRETWSLFCSILRKTLSKVNAGIVAFLSDQEKGIWTLLKGFSPIAMGFLFY